MYEFVFCSVHCLCAHNVIRLLTYSCVCIYSIIEGKCVPARTDNMLINVCEEAACEIQGGQC